MVKLERAVEGGPTAYNESTALLGEAGRVDGLAPRDVAPADRVGPERVTHSQLGDLRLVVVMPAERRCADVPRAEHQEGCCPHGRDEGYLRVPAERYETGT